MAMIVAVIALARQYTAPYSLQVKLATHNSSNTVANAVYIWPWVKHPGAYSYTNGMTIAHLVDIAGGFIKDESSKNFPLDPQTVSVYRPSEADPDPTKSVFHYSLDWSKTNGGIELCDFKLVIGDLVAVSMSKVVP